MFRVCTLSRTNHLDCKLATTNENGGGLDAGRCNWLWQIGLGQTYKLRMLVTHKTYIYAILMRRNCCVEMVFQLRQYSTIHLCQMRMHLQQHKHVFNVGEFMKIRRSLWRNCANLASKTFRMSDLIGFVQYSRWFVPTWTRWFVHPTDPLHSNPSNISKSLRRETPLYLFHSHWISGSKDVSLWTWMPVVSKRLRCVQ